MPDLVDIRNDPRGECRPGDRELARLAACQHGVVARRQLVELGYGRGAIQYRMAMGRLHLVHRGVYAVGHPALDRPGRFTAAVLACGRGALLSHRSAGSWWGLRDTERRLIDVTTPFRSHRGSPGMDLHQVRGLHPDDRTVRNGIPVTSVARTLLDLAELLLPRQLAFAFEQAERLRLLDLRAIEELCERSRGRRGLRPLAALMAEHQPETVHARSGLERRFLEFCRDAGLPAPVLNTTVAGFEVDATWPGRRLVVELDSPSFHQTRAAFERDRAKDAVLQLAGYRVMRLTPRRLGTEPAIVADSVRSLLAMES